ncbi:MAG: SWIM zinc finger family protein [Verrucomicrobiaceae bacterium]|nr:MAG: SWIM zinc finger family protein [Verrucomicrobiaceae bacterium]
MLTPDQITAIAPDAASLKAGRDLGTPRKWESMGGDTEVLWGLAMGSGKQPYQTRVRLADLASKCSCPSRKFPCKHALGLMFLATGQPAALTQTARPAWVTEWMDAHAERVQKAETRAEEKESKPVDEKAAAKRKAQKESRVADGIQLLQQSILDLTREGLASGNARDAAAWENLARRMVDCQVPGLAGAVRHVTDVVLRDPEVDHELPLELGRLHLLLKTGARVHEHEGALRAEILGQLGVRDAEEKKEGELIEDRWFVAARTIEERDRLITSATWILGQQTGRWGKVLRFTPAMQAIGDPWPVGASVRAGVRFQAGLSPVRVLPEGDGEVSLAGLPGPHESGFEFLLDRFSSALSDNPFVRTLPFLILLRPGADGRSLVDATGRSLPWRASADLAFRVECVCAGNLTLACGEWDGRHLRLLTLRDGDVWYPLTSQQP